MFCTHRSEYKQMRTLGLPRELARSVYSVLKKMRVQFLMEITQTSSVIASGLNGAGLLLSTTFFHHWTLPLNLIGIKRVPPVVVAADEDAKLAQAGGHRASACGAPY